RAHGDVLPRRRGVEPRAAPDRRRAPDLPAGGVAGHPARQPRGRHRDDARSRRPLRGPAPERVASAQGDGGVVLDDANTAESATAAALAATVLDEEAARQAAQARAREQVLFPDDLLPGVNAPPMSLREGLRAGGHLMFIVLTAIVLLAELEEAAVFVLAPEIRRTFHISEGAMVFIGTASAAFFVLGAVPMGWLADRVKRVPIVGASSILFGAFVLASGFAVNAFMLFWTRFATGITKANTIAVHGPLIADNYPIGVRARVSAISSGGARAVGQTSSPVLAAVIAQAAGG